MLLQKEVHVTKIINTMKITICLISSILLISCSTSKIEKNVLNDFLKNQLTKSPYIKVVVKEPLQTLLSLECYEKAYQDRNIRLGDMIRIRPESNPPFIWPIDSSGIIKLKEKYKKDTISPWWHKNDFQGSKLKLANGKAIRDFKSRLSLRYFGDEGITFSKPIITADKKFALLFFKTFTLGKYSTHPMQKAILMENKEGSWRIKEIYDDPNVIN